MTSPVQPAAIVHKVDVQFSFEDRAKANSLSCSIESTVTRIFQHELGLLSGRAQLGSQLLEVRAKQFHKLWGFETFGAYIAHVETKTKLGRSQIYNYIGVAEKLSPFVTDVQLQEMGIAKASELKKVVAATAAAPSKELVAKACDRNVSGAEFRQAIFNETHVETRQEGKWYDLQGFYVDTDEESELDRFFDVAKKTDPVVDHTLPEWAQRKECLLRAAREFLSTYGPEGDHAEPQNSRGGDAGE